MIPKTEHNEQRPAAPTSAPRLYRRQFLVGVAAATSVVPLLQRPASAAAPANNSGAPNPAVAKTGVAPATPAAARGYELFSLDEAAFVEAMVNIMCPADSFTPNGVDCGLADYIDRQLAGGYGKGARLYMHGPWGHGKPQLGYQLPLTPEQYFKTGLAAANRAANAAHNKDFPDLAPADANAFLHDISTGKIDDKSLALSPWFNELVYPLFEQACYADPMYGGNRNKVFWKMIGYPGLPATYTTDMTEYRGKPFPGREHPEGIPAFS